MQKTVKKKKIFAAAVTAVQIYWQIGEWYQFDTVIHPIKQQTDQKKEKTEIVTFFFFLQSTYIKILFQSETVFLQLKLLPKSKSKKKSRKKLETEH